MMADLRVKEDIEKKVIIEKLDTKTAVMQELLKEKKRLPRFDGQWTKRRLDDLAEKITIGGTPSRPVDAYWNGSIPWVKIKDLSSSSRYTTEEYITPLGLKNSSAKLVPSETLIVSIKLSLGRVAIYKVDVTTNEAIVAIFTNSNFDKNYLYYWFQMNERFIDHLGRRAAKGKVVSVNDLGSIEIYLPDQKAEQTAIAAALSDVDELIISLKKLIAKKRDMKTAVMQELLTGKKRLPGFNGQWKDKKMAQESHLKARIGWQGLTTAEYLETGEYILITGTDFKNGKVDWSNCCYVEQERYDQDKNIQVKPGDILLTQRGTVGKVAYVDQLPKPATLNTGIFVIRPIDKRYHPLYFYYVLSSEIFEGFLNKVKVGLTMNHLCQKDFVHFPFKAPSVQEQKAIATVLYDMDAEIGSLEKRLEKACSLKEGMMQELLTGKTRLIKTDKSRGAA